MTVGQNIKKIRLEKGLTQKQLAEKCGMFDSALRRIENGKQNPKIETVEKIAKALGVEVVDILFTEDKATLYKQQKTEAINIALYDFETYTEKRIEEDMIKKYRKLNFTGQQKANEYITDLSEQEKYTKPDNED